mmetsp:Transcript_29073/g.73454  ORF Transcript_29073/g.73454 Transcript_29073/m.73454 type:complete len:343 (-) Transcript_29073:7-1035(-)
MDPVVLSNVHRRCREVGRVVVQELVLQIRSGVLRIEAVNEPCLIRCTDVIDRRVAILLGVVHCIVQHPHLAQGRLARETAASRTNRVGERRSEVDEGSRHPGLLLSLKHGIECADQRARHLHGALWPSNVCGRRHLEIRLVEDVHVLQRGVVLTVCGQETFVQVLKVQRFHLRETIEVRCGQAAPRSHLVVRVIAHPCCHAQALLDCLVEEVRVVIGGVVAVETDHVGPHAADDPQVATASTPPHGHCFIAEPIVGRQRRSALDGLKRHRPVAHPSDEPGPSSACGAYYRHRNLPDDRQEADAGERRSPDGHRYGRELVLLPANGTLRALGSMGRARSLVTP